MMFASPRAQITAAIAAGVAVSAVFFWAVNAWRPNAEPTPTAAPSSAAALAPPAAAPSVGPAGSQQQFTTQVDDQAEVEVSATPRTVDTSGTTFAVVFNTHSVELDYDFAAISTLLADGTAVRPLRWEGGRGGHHLEGQLVFPPLPAGVQQLELRMAGIAGVDRRFRWPLTP